MFGDTPDDVVVNARQNDHESGPIQSVGGQMRIAVIGGGPGGLYFSALAQQLAASTGQQHEITVWERNAADDTFGFGVVFSDETLGGIEHADPVVFAQMQREFAIWDDIDVHFKGEVITSGGHGFAAMSRRRLLELLQERCRELDVTLHFRTEAPDIDELRSTHDLVVAADGLNSGVRRGTPTPSGRASTCATAATSGWAPTGSSTRSSSTSARRRTA